MKKNVDKAQRILIISPCFEYGGAEKYACWLMNELVEKGKEVIFVSSGGALEHQLNKKIHFVKLPMLTKSVYSLLKLSYEIRKIVKKYKVQVIHAQSIYTTIIGKLFLPHIPIVVTIHGLKEKQYPLANVLMKIFSEKIITVSTKTKQSMSQPMNVDNKLEVIYNATKVLERKEKKWSLDGHIRIGIIARLHEDKGHTILLQSFRKLLESNPHAILYVVGDGPEREKLENWVQENEMKGKVIFTGFQTDVGGVLEKLDIVVLPSFREGLPLTILEAMSYGKCMIATKVGGIPEAIENGVSGILCKAGDVQGLFQALKITAQSEELRYRLGRAAYHKVKHTFSDEVCYQKIISVYNNVLDREIVSE
ncbi:glycosyltransferase [Bacillus thuringiensis]|uniref:glycosyltransferase n=1 Tax=Bacillus thuringiensis TaxID=1428 RepID=UPI000E4B00E5|nr:glycosyltransferase [Bacillus thuringiensis]MDZ3952452.1 glycosyltransferase [Bacillus thuringiensis]RGP53828.1 glycosyl transferase [Bacillus thuringiensis]